MRQDVDFWHNQQRPLPNDLLEYAAQDVLYLPQVYECMRKYFLLPHNDQIINSITGEVLIKTVTVSQKIMSDSSKFQEYPKINKGVKLSVGLEIQAFVKNYRRDVIFCSLNLGGGVSGVIKDAESRKLLERYHLFGDIVTCKVIGFEQRKS